jgi:hypothetical protein
VLARGREGEKREMMGMARVSRSSFATFCIVAATALCLIALAALGAGCGSSKKTTPTTAPKSTPKSTPATTPSGATSLTKVLTGTGNATTDPFRLTAGLAVFTIRNSSNGTFIVTLTDNTGKPLSQLVSVNEQFNGSTALGVSAGQYKLNVVSNGTWEVDANEQVPSSPQFTPLYSSGTGPLVTPFFQSAGGNATFTMNYSGTIPFVVTLLTSTGETVSVLVNQAGPFSGQKTIVLQQNLVYLIDVEGGGAWSVSVQ